MQQWSPLKLREPLKYPVPYSRTKRYQSFVNYALAHFQNNKWVRFILLFMLWTVFCIMCILYRVFLLYHISYCSLYVVYVLPIQLLGCHSSNKHLSCLVLYVMPMHKSYISRKNCRDSRLTSMCLKRQRKWKWKWIPLKRWNVQLIHVRR